MKPHFCVYRKDVLPKREKERERRCSRIGIGNSMKGRTDEQEWRGGRKALEKQIVRDKLVKQPGRYRKDTSLGRRYKSEDTKTRIGCEENGRVEVTSRRRKTNNTKRKETNTVESAGTRSYVCMCKG